MIVLVALMAVAFTHASAEVCSGKTVCAKMSTIFASSNEILSLLKRDQPTPLEATLQGIDKDRFVVSEAYMDRIIYLATKVEAPFNIQKANEDCKSQGGYLVELNDAVEASYVINFVKKVGGPDTEFATGANDLDKEGTFVYYNSGKPVPRGLPWSPGEPNNNGPNRSEEDCVFFWSHDKRLNDASCNLATKYVCEVLIPLTI